MKPTTVLLATLPWLITACGTWLPAAHRTPEIATHAPLPADLSGISSHTSDQWPAASWWQKYQDSTLDSLIARALATAPSIATAEARFSSARESARISAAAAGLRV